LLITWLDKIVGNRDVGHYLVNKQQHANKHDGLAERTFRN